MLTALVSCGDDDGGGVREVRLDTSFGSGGVVFTPMGEDRSGGLPLPGGSAVAIQPDGRIVVAGEGAPFGVQSITVVRYQPGGALDLEFGQAGVATAEIGGRSDAKAMILQEDGSIVVAGSANPRPSTYRVLAVARFDPAGVLDATFASGGIATTDLDDIYAEANALELERDGSLLVAGHNVGHPVVLRYQPNGTLDPSFADGGVFRLPAPRLGERGLFAAITTDVRERLLVAGSFATSDDRYDLGVVALDASGTLDSKFGPGGIAVSPIGLRSESRAAVADFDGGIVVAGNTQPPLVDGRRYDIGDVVLAGYDHRGVLDTNFGNRGVATIGGEGLQEANAMAIQSDGRLVVVGGSEAPFRLRILVARFLPNGQLDRTFAGGVLHLDLGIDAELNAVAFQSDGKIVVAGGAIDAQYHRWFVVARFVVE